MQYEQAIQLVAGARAALERAREWQDYRALSALADAAAVLLRKRDDARAAYVHATEIAVRCERAMGDMLKRTVERGDQSAPLKKLGLSRWEAARMRALSDVPDDELDAHVACCTARGEAVTRSSVRALSKSKRRAASVAKDTELAREAADNGLLCTARVGDIRLGLPDVPDGSVDAVITDPPYPREYVPLYADLGRLAARVLKPGGLLVAMSGQSYLPDLFRELGAVSGLHYRWTAAYLTPGGQAVQLWDRRVNTFWKPLLVYSVPGGESKWFGDVARSDVNDNDKRLHEWGQSESGMRSVIERFTRPGDVVLDPFCGSATTGAVCRALARHFQGFDVDADRVSVACGRLA